MDAGFILSKWATSSSLIPTVLNVSSDLGAFRSAILGLYEFYNKFSVGRPVYKRRDGDGPTRYLMMRKPFTNWNIWTKLGGGIRLARSGRGTLSPNQAGARGTTRGNFEGWQVFIGQEWVDDDTLRVTKVN